MSEQRRIVVTSALPYANGDIHIGHLVEYVQTDFWVRYQKMRGNRCLYICADDTHGTPVMIRARKEGITPEELIARSHAAHLKDFTDFQIAFDSYYTTNSDENKALSERIYGAADGQGYVTAHKTPQLYCEHCRMFLPDRYVKGTCPKCGAEGQYGDSCDHCGETYGAEELGHPVCTTCGATPVVRDAEHLYFELEPQHEYLRQWLPEHTTSDISNKLLEWFREPLRGWCISRSAPYFGFAIPGHPDKYFYVWVDAPIGYIASLQNWCTTHGERLEDWWPSASAAAGQAQPPELYHFIGKDIIRFHCLFWPGMLRAAGFKGPDKVFVHGFLTVNGVKMSKSKGTFINARTFLGYLPADALRYYYAAKLGGTADDMDLNTQEFVSRHNAELVGKITNIASRSAQMLQKKLDGRLGTLDGAGRRLLDACRAAGETVASYYEARRFNLAVTEICRLADAINAFFDERAPWKTVKEDAELTRTTLTAVLNAFRVLAVYLAPVLPAYAERVRALFGETDGWTWASAQETREESALGAYTYLANRLEHKAFEDLIEASKDRPADTGEVAHESRPSKEKAKKAAAAEAAPAALKAEVAFADFDKVDLRIGVVRSCEVVPKSAKLLKFVLDAGALGERTIFSGIRGAYPDPAALVGQEVVFVANLAPRRMSVGVSEGMILFAGTPGTDGGVLSPRAPAAGGAVVS